MKIVTKMIIIFKIITISADLTALIVTAQMCICCGSNLISGYLFQTRLKCFQLWLKMQVKIN